MRCSTGCGNLFGNVTYNSSAVLPGTMSYAVGSVLYNVMVAATFVGVRSTCWNCNECITEIFIEPGITVAAFCFCYSY